MEYISPGVPSGWMRILVTSLCVLILGQFLGVVQANRQRQHHNNMRHNNHYQFDTFHTEADRDYEQDYEDSTEVVEPKFLQTKTNISVTEGKMARLPCAVRNLSTKKVAWRLVGAQDDHFLTVGDFTWARDNEIVVDYKAGQGPTTHWDLIIKSVKMSDEGVYECQVTSKAPIRTRVRLTVTKRQEREPAVKITGKEFVDRNEQIHLKCNATGGPRIPVEIDWFKDGTKIDPSLPKFKGVVMTKYRSLEHHAMISELIIEKTDEQHTGTYICRSSDKKIISHKVTVLVADTTNVKRAFDTTNGKQAFDTTNVKRGTASKQDGSSSDSSKKSRSGGSAGQVEKALMPTGPSGSSAESAVLSFLLPFVSVIVSLLL